MAELRDNGGVVEVLDARDLVVARFARTSFSAVVTPYSFGAKGDGAADDTNAILNAIDSCPVGGVLDVTGFFKVSSPITITKAIRLRGLGSADNMQSRIISTAGISSGSVVSFSPGSLTKGFAMEGIYIDATNSPLANALEVHNADSPRVVDVKTRGGLNSLHIGNSQNGRFRDFYGVNPNQYGLLGDNASATSNGFINTWIYQTSGATHDIVAGYEIENGVDWQFHSPYFLRTPGIAFKAAYGFRALYASPNTLAQIWIDDGDFDAVTTLVNDDNANCAGILLKNVQTVRITNGTWVSAAPAADNKFNQAIAIDNSKDIDIHLAKVNGRGGIYFYNTVDDILVSDSEFQNGGAGSAFVLGSATLTNLRQHHNRFLAGTASDNSGAFATAQTVSGVP